MVVGADGTLQNLEMKGPSDYWNWRECWEVYTTAMVMLGATIPPTVKK